MYNRNSDYARNKLDGEAIVYQDACGNLIRLTSEDYDTEEEFRHWKAWSDADYHRTEKSEHIYANHTVSFEDLPDRLSALPSIDSTLADEFDQQEQKRLLALKECGTLTETQFRYAAGKLKEQYLSAIRSQTANQ